jgi:hypothetical protein
MIESKISQAAKRPAHHFNEAQHCILVVEDEASPDEICGLQLRTNDW